MTDNPIGREPGISLAQRIYWLRQTLGLSTRRLAGLVPCSPGWITRLECGETRVSSQMLARLALALETTEAYLSGRTSDPSPPGPWIPPPIDKENPLSAANAQGTRRKGLTDEINSPPSPGVYHTPGQLLSGLPLAGAAAMNASPKSPAGNNIVPNSFPTPNLFVDRLMFYLTPPEWMVLSYATRMILGWQEKVTGRQDYISLSQFAEGQTSESGEWHSLGCGMAEDTIAKALDGLARFRLLWPVGDPDPRRGQLYHLVESDEQIDWDGLAARKAEAEERARSRTAAATAARQAGRAARAQPGPANVDVAAEVVRGTDPERYVGRTATGTPDVPLAVRGTYTPKATKASQSQESQRARALPRASQPARPAPKPPAEPEHPALLRYERITGCRPEPRYTDRTAFPDARFPLDRMAAMMSTFTDEYLRGYFDHWVGRGHNPYYPGWLDWAAAGKIPPTKEERAAAAEEAAHARISYLPDGYEEPDVPLPVKPAAKAKLWARVLAELAGMMTAASFNQVTPGVELISVAGGIATVQVPDDARRDLFENRLARLVRDAFAAAGEPVETLAFTVPEVAGPEQVDKPARRRPAAGKGAEARS